MIYTSWKKKKKVKGNPFEFSQTFENIKIIGPSISKIKFKDSKVFIVIIPSMEKGKN